MKKSRFSEPKIISILTRNGGGDVFEEWWGSGKTERDQREWLASQMERIRSNLTAQELR